MKQISSRVLVLAATAAAMSSAAYASSQQETFDFFSTRTCKVAEYESVRPRGAPMPLVQVTEAKPTLDNIFPAGQAQMIFSDGQAIELSAGKSADGTYAVSIGVLSKRFLIGGYDRKSWSGFGEASIENGGRVSVSADSTTKVFKITCE